MYTLAFSPDKGTCAFGNVLVSAPLVCEDDNLGTVELQWLEHLWKHENMFETGVVRVNEGKSLCQVKRHYKDIF